MSKINKIKETLSKSGFFVSEEFHEKCFDIIARRDDTLLLIRYSKNVDAILPDAVMELNKLSCFLSASPLIIGERTNTGKIKDDVVYTRRGVSVISKKTLEHILLHNIYPVAYSSPGGLYVKIDGEKLKKIRMDKGISLGELAKSSGVSRRMIQMYENNMNATISVGMRIEEFLGTSIILPIDPLQFYPKINKSKPISKRIDPLIETVTDLLQNIGYSTLLLFRSPFNTLIKYKKTTVISDIKKDSSMLNRIAKLIAKISIISEKLSVFFVEKSTKENIEGTPIIKIDELFETKEPEEIMKLMIERKE